MRHYSRLAKIEEAKNKRTAIKFGVLTVVLIIALLIFGVPLLARFAGFLGDLRGSSLPIEKNDNTPPAPPFLTALPDYVRSRKLTVEGTAEEGSTVSVFRNDESSEVVAGSAGEFSVSLALDDGKNEIYAKAKDKSGNESAESRKFVVVFDNDKPEIDIIYPSDGASFSGQAGRQLRIEGKTESGASVTIADRLATIDAEGKFSFVVSLSEGENTFVIKAVDKAGNESEKTLRVNFTP